MGGHADLHQIIRKIAVFDIAIFDVVWHVNLPRIYVMELKISWNVCDLITCSTLQLIEFVKMLVRPFRPRRPCRPPAAAAVTGTISSSGEIETAVE